MSKDDEQRAQKSWMLDMLHKLRVAASSPSASHSSAKTPSEEQAVMPTAAAAAITDDASRRPSLHPALATGIGAAFLLNVGIMLSLPPVLRGKGAPYLPTFQKSMNAMFRQLQNETRFQELLAAAKSNRERGLRFVDLGSGDGRLVFRAARENIFRESIGYEINPLLHLFAKLQRAFRGPKYWSSTNFFMRDIWKVDLRDVDVVAVYGLGPIMKDLGVKLKQELKPGSFVLSNVFSIPGWNPSSSSENTYIYIIPDKQQPGNNNIEEADSLETTDDDDGNKEQERKASPARHGHTLSL